MELDECSFKKQTTQLLSGQGGKHLPTAGLLKNCWHS